MPPKPRFTKEAIAGAALEIIKEEGTSALTARSLGNRLGTSASPIFTVFQSMNEVKLAARELALREFEGYISDFNRYSPAFKRIGMKMVSYAVSRPEMFKLLFMQDFGAKQSFEDIVHELGSMVPICISLLQRDHGLSEEAAKALFEQMWIYTFGIGALCANGVCSFTEEEISRRLGEVFLSLLHTVKSGKSPVPAVTPQIIEEKSNT